MTTYAPKRTTLTGNEIVLNANDRARAFWLIQKFTSLAYTRRMSVLFFNFVGGYEDFVKNKSGSSVKFYRDNLTEFYKDQALLTKGLDLLERGYKVGYASIAQGCAFNDFLLGRRFEAGIENQEIGWRYRAPAVGLYAWAEVAIIMSGRILTVLGAELSFSQISNPFPGQPAAGAHAAGAFRPNERQGSDLRDLAADLGSERLPELPVGGPRGSARPTAHSAAGLSRVSRRQRNSSEAGPHRIPLRPRARRLAAALGGPPLRAGPAAERIRVPRSQHRSPPLAAAGQPSFLRNASPSGAT